MAKKYISEFVKKQQALNKRIVQRMLWFSEKQGTYITKKHGLLI